MPRENSNVAAVAVVIIAGLFLVLLLGVAALAVFGFVAMRSVAPPPAIAMSAPPEVPPPRLDAAENDFSLYIEADGSVTAEGQPQSNELLKVFFASYKAADKLPVIVAHQDAPPDRLAKVQELCTQIVGLPAEVKVVTTADTPTSIIPPTEAPAENAAP
jgi:hypothetical protein